MKRREFLGQVAATASVPLGLGALIHVAVAPESTRAPVLAPARAFALADGARVNRWLAQFDRIGRTPGGINRVAYSDADLAGRTFTLDLFRLAGLTPRIDAAGNIIGRVEGTDRALRPIVIGSHIDSVTDGGNFDGPLGSFGAIEVARTLREQGTRLRHPLEVVVWSNEEGGVIGSKLAVGDFKSVDLDGVARSGKTIREGIGLVGGNVAALERDVRARGSAACYLELHIEQGGLLEQAGLLVGVVQGIVGLRFFEVTVEGVANHAGATPMDQRHDAVLAAARFTVAVNEAIRSEPGRQVATVGRVVPSPNTRNVIAGRVELTVDLRDLDVAKLARFTERFKRLGGEIGAASGTTFSFREFTSSAPALADEAMMAAVESSAAQLGLSRQRMQSGAGHDAQEMSLICPMGMIFVPSVGGVSHSPKEFTKAEDIVNGVNVLLNTVLRVDAR